MTESLSAAQARRVFLNAQGLTRSRPRRRVGAAQFEHYLETQGVLQLDTVNVLARAHYMPIFSRYGSYDMASLDRYLWGDERGHSAHAFEHWGHEASVMPRELLPALHFRMAAALARHGEARRRMERERPGLMDDLVSYVEQHGPCTAGEVEHLSPHEGKRGPWWDASHVKHGLELLFHEGRVAASRGRHFARTYDATTRAWGLADASVGSWGLPATDARQALFDRALTAVGVGTVKDVCDHFRLPYQAGPKTPDVAGGQVWAASAVERGIARWVTVEGWREPALVALHAEDPGRATGAALLSPFDPVCWFRPRLKRMFGMDYRIEIYTPEPMRVYGYYCLPFLLGDQIVGRVDLKADRKAGALLVQAAWREPDAVAGARKRSDDEVAAALAAELEMMRSWLSLDRIQVSARGSLAAPLSALLAAAAGK